MKENRYDDPVFFRKYSEMARSRLGLEGAGEWKTLRPMLPDFTGKRVLDLGCGYGWHAFYAAENGAEKVLGIDLSEKMLAVAREKNTFPSVRFARGAMEDVRFPDGSFDAVLSSLALHYVKDYAELVPRVYRWLAPGGAFVFSAEHPTFTAYGNQDWYYSPEGEILHFPVDRYFYEGEREAVFLGETVKKCHRTVDGYLKPLWQTGFTVEDLSEPRPPEEMMDLPGMKDEMRRPMMLLVSARKPL
mgnify:FL=1